MYFKEMWVKMRMTQDNCSKNGQDAIKLTITYLQADGKTVYTSDNRDFLAREQAIPTQLSPLTLKPESTPVTILAQIINTFVPELSEIEAQALAEHNLHAVYRKKQPVSLKPLTKTQALGVTYQSLNMTERDLAACLYFDLLLYGRKKANKPLPNVILTKDPQLLVALATRLPKDLTLIGLIDEIEQLPSILQEQIKAVNQQSQCQISELSADDDHQALKTFIAKARATDDLVEVTLANLAVIIPQILAFFLLSQAWSQKTSVHFTLNSTTFDGALAALYAKKLGCPLTEITVAIPKNSPADRFFNHNGESLSAAAMTNLRRLAFTLSADTQVLKDNTALRQQLKTFMKVVAINPKQVATEIRRMQNQLTTTISPDTAYATLAAQDEPTIILATTDPYQAPETVLQALINRNDQKTGFEAVQLLRPLLDHKAPRRLTQLKRLAPIALKPQSDQTIIQTIKNALNADRPR